MGDGGGASTAGPVTPGWPRRTESAATPASVVPGLVSPVGRGDSEEGTASPSRSRPASMARARSGPTPSSAPKKISSETGCARRATSCALGAVQPKSAATSA